MSSTALISPAATKTVAATSSENSVLRSSGSSIASALSKSIPILSKSGSQSGPQVSTPQKLHSSGRWQHPRLDEVIRRRNATKFDSSNITAIGFNATLILVSLFVPSLLQRTVPTPWLFAAQPYPAYALYALRLLCLANISLSLLPLFRAPDACEDVPLTPAQRQLLGLPPMSRPATPQEQEQWVTPPRFSRSATPRSASSSLFAEASQSPLLPPDTSASSNNNSGGRRSFNNSPSLWTSPFGSARRASGFRGDSERRRLSFHSNRGSPLSVSELDAAAGSLIATPTKGTRASVGLNNKWLYEKGRGSPGRSSLFS